MSPILLPLAMIVASIAPDARGVASLPKASGFDDSWVYSAYWGAPSQQGAPSSTAPSSGSALPAGSSYPASYGWSAEDSRDLLGQFDLADGQAGFGTAERRLAGLSADPDEPREDEFNWTRGGGLIGVGFSWRFR